jgi:hypothetical protein
MPSAAELRALGQYVSDQPQPGRGRQLMELLGQTWPVRGAKAMLQHPGNVMAGLADAGDVEGALDVVGGAMTGGFGAAKAAGLRSAGETIGIVPIPVAKRIDMPVTTSTNPLLAEAVPGTPPARLTPEGLEMGLQRQQKPAQHGDDSVRTGVFYLPPGAPNMRYYKTSGKPGENYYGGPDRIEGESLFKNPLVVKGATGGKVPEAAFDAIHGKGASKKLAEDAQSAMPLYWEKDPAVKRLAVEGFLQKYAPDHVDMADHIMANSSKGNQLRYALQELAVAHAARKAGHDAVMGVSKTKGKPALSEVFDVREQSYPTPEGDYTLMPQFRDLYK